MNVTLMEFSNLLSDFNGYCTHCDKVVDKCAGDEERGLECPECEYKTVIGVMAAKIDGLIKVTDQK